MLIQTFNMGVTEVNFYMNQSEIAQKLCENKDKPQMHCNGHCQLKKELEKHNDQDAVPQLKEIKLFVDTAVSLHPTKEIFRLNTELHAYSEDLITPFQSAIFHPPAC